MIGDARGLDSARPRRFTWSQHTSAVADLTDLKAVAEIHRGEIAELLKRVTGCDEVAMTPFGILRFSEKARRERRRTTTRTRPASPTSTWPREPRRPMRAKARAGRQDGGAQRAVQRVARARRGAAGRAAGLCAYPSVARAT